MEQTITKPKLKHKTFSYRTTLEWAGGKAGLLRAPDKQEFRVASPPEFKGEAGVWTPEDLFVASVEICTMTTFLAFAQRLGLPLASYTSNAEGILEFVNGRYEFTKIVVRPTVMISSHDLTPQVEQALHDAHKSCLIANSMKAEIVIEPSIIVQGAEATLPA